jgi:uncharacterized membrane protein HdeD (DUF308 family)
VTALGTLKRNWWTLVLRGVFAIAFGFFAWFWPAATLLALLSIWGVFAIASGVITLLGAFTGAEARGMLLLEGSVSVLAGAVALFNPRLTALLFLYLLAAWAVLGGAVQIIAALRLRKEIRGEFWLGFAGVLSLLFGILLIAWPRAGALTVIWMIAGYAVLYGVVLIAWGLHLKRLHALGGTTRVEIRVNQ